MRFDQDESFSDFFTDTETVQLFVTHMDAPFSKPFEGLEADDRGTHQGISTFETSTPHLECLLGFEIPWGLNHEGLVSGLLLKSWCGYET